MAGYHYKFQIIPSSSTVNNVEDYWFTEQPDIEMLYRYRQLLPDSSTWGETEEYRCKTNHSVLYIWWEAQKVWSIQFEYAPVENGDDLLLNEVLALCKMFGYMLYSEQTQSVIAPSKNELWQDFKRCSQYRIYEHRINEFH
jgi:hypothetical protein